MPCDCVYVWRVVLAFLRGTVRAGSVRSRSCSSDCPLLSSALIAFRRVLLVQLQPPRIAHSRDRRLLFNLRLLWLLSANPGVFALCSNGDTVSFRPPSVTRRCRCPGDQVRTFSQLAGCWGRLYRLSLGSLPTREHPRRQKLRSIYPRIGPL